MRRVLCALSIALTALVTVQAGGGVATALPSGFTDSVVTGLGTLTAVEALPDGRVIALQQNGRLVRIDDRDGSPDVRTMAQFDVCSNSERGLLGFTVDPAFVTRGFVYVFRTVSTGGSCVNRVSRFVMDENGLDLRSEKILVDRISSLGGNHNGGDVEIGNDGFLYITTGDAGRDPRRDSGSAGSNDAAQDLSLLNGKILRVDRNTGFAPKTNPFTGAGTADCRTRGNTASTPTSTCREIFSAGLRNPYRFAFDPNTSDTRFFINDVGQGDREEVNEEMFGGNYGWPEREGRCPRGQNPPCAGPPNGITDPITDYGHSDGLFITGGAFVPNGVWPDEYDDAYLVSDGAFGTFWVYRDETNLADAEVFLTAQAPTDMTFVAGPTGTALWYVEQNGEVHKVTVDLPGQPDDSGALRYDPLPVIDRRFDSRRQTPRASLRAGETRLIDLDAPAGAEAALVNITMASPQGQGAYLTVWEPGTDRPATATINADVGSVVANASIVPVDDDGNILVFAQATTDVIVDVAGFYVDAPDAVAAGRLESIPTERVADSRRPAVEGIDGSSYVRRPDGDGERLTIPVVRPGSADEVDAIVVTITGIGSDGPGAGFVTAYASGAERPTASNLNVNPGRDVRANLAVVAVPSSGSIELYLERVDDVAVDVVGFITSDDVIEAEQGRFHLIPPTREADSRRELGFGRFDAGEFQRLDIASVTRGATAIVQNLTMVRTGGRGFVTADAGAQRPGVSNVNASGPDQIRGSLAISSQRNGGVTFFSSAATDLTVDVFGWYE